MADGFHFLAPAWLWLLGRGAARADPWRKVVDPLLQPLLLGGAAGRARQLPLWLLGAGWLLAVLALANPTWERQPHPLLQAGGSRVIVLDLSRSMLAADLRPSRLLRARFKVEDLLRADDAGQVGLVVFAGDAFTVAPLTRDADTLRAQLAVLEPALMPAQGSRADLGLAQAHELLRQAAVERGEVILIADGVSGDATGAAARLRADGHRVSVLGVGTSSGAPLPGGRSSEPLVVRLERAALEAVAAAGGGRYATITADAADVGVLLAAGLRGTNASGEDDLETLAWEARGPLLAALLLPLAAVAFRRGWLLSLLLVAGTAGPPAPAYALAWDDLWLRPEQQAARALVDGDFERARALASDPLRRGAAAYRQGDFSAALEAFREGSGADAAYNRGNALAMLGDYRAAIEAYDAALGERPGMDDAAFNKAVLEELLRQRDAARRDPDAETAQSDPQADQQQPAEDAADGSEGQQGQQDPQDGDTGQDGGEDAAAQAGDENDAQQGDSTGQDGQDAASDDGADGETAAAGTPSDSAAGDAGPGREAGDAADGDEPGGSDAAAAAGQGGESAAGGDGVASTGEAADTGGRPGDPDADLPGQADEAATRREQDGEPSRPEPGAAAGDQDTADGAGSADAAPSTQDDGVDATDAPTRAAGRPDAPGDSFAEANRRLEQRERAGDADAGPEQAQAGAAQPGDEQRAPAGAGRVDETDGRAAPLSSEEQLAAEQWLRRIPDDPGGLLRRKFLYQYRQRGMPPPAAGAQDW